MRAFGQPWNHYWATAYNIHATMGWLTIAPVWIPSKVDLRDSLQVSLGPTAFAITETLQERSLRGLGAAVDFLPLKGRVLDGAPPFPTGLLIQLRHGWFDDAPMTGLGNALHYTLEES